MTGEHGVAPQAFFDGYAFDLDGTVYLGDDLMPGAAETVTGIRRAGCRVVFVTNNPLHSAADYARKLSERGIEAAEHDVVTATDALILYLSAAHRSAKLMIIGEKLLRDTIAAAGFLLTDEPSAAEVVVVSFDRTFDYAKLHAAYRAVRLHGAHVVATNPDPYCPTPEGGLPDCAAMLAAVEACTGATAEAVAGKPSRYMASAVLDRLGIPAPGVAMVGDRLATDIAMARTAGMIGVLVLTGATTRSDLAASEPCLRPDYVIGTLPELLPGTPTGHEAATDQEARDLERA